MLRIIRKTAVAVAVVTAFVGVLAFQGCTTEEEEGDDVGGGGYGVNVDVGGKSVAQIIQDGDEALAVLNYPEAFAYYEAAYKKDPNDIRAIAYSSLAKIAAISVDPKVGSLFKDHFGFEKYPSNLNALIEPFLNGEGGWLKKYKSVKWYYYDDKLGEELEWMDQWYVDYYDEIDKVGYYYYGCDDDWYSCGYKFVTSTPQTEDNWLPGLLTPSWVKGDKNTVYGQSLLNGVESMETYPILLLANLVDKNTNGFNSLLDDVIAAVFNDNGSFGEVRDRIAKIDKDATVSLSELFVSQMGLDEAFPGDAEIGWAELNLVVMYMTAIKASLEYVAAYDWSTNLSVLKNTWKPNDDYIYERFKALNVNDMPFKSNLLNARPGKMAAAKSDFVKVLNGLDDSYKVIRDRNWVPTEVAVAYPVVHDAITKLKSTIENGGIFWIPDPDGISSIGDLTWPSANGPKVLGGYDMGKFFQEGYFSLKNLFETESNKSPAFYTMGGVKLTVDNYEDILFDFINSREGCDYEWDYDCYDIYEDTYVGFKFKTSTITDLVQIGKSPNAEEIVKPEGDQILPMFTPEPALLFFAKYNGLELPDISLLSNMRKRASAPLSLSKSR